MTGQLVRAFSDPEWRPGHFLHVEKYASYRANMSRARIPIMYTDRYRIDEWIPYDSENSNWHLRRTLIGPRRWIHGGRVRAAILGLSTRPLTPTGQWEGPQGEYFSNTISRSSPIASGWDNPSLSFLSSLPDNANAISTLLRNKWALQSGGTPGTYLTPAVSILASGRAPARLRSILLDVLLADSRICKVLESDNDQFKLGMYDPPDWTVELAINRWDGQPLRTRTIAACREGPLQAFNSDHEISRVDISISTSNSISTD